MKVQSKEAGVYFLKWLDQIENSVDDFNSYRTGEEKAAILGDIKKPGSSTVIAKKMEL